MHQQRATVSPNSRPAELLLGEVAVCMRYTKSVPDFWDGLRIHAGGISAFAMPSHSIPSMLHAGVPVSRSAGTSVLVESQTTFLTWRARRGTASETLADPLLLRAGERSIDWLPET
jgi:hypothetical protein